MFRSVQYWLLHRVWLVSTLITTNLYLGQWTMFYQLSDLCLWVINQLVLSLDCCSCGLLLFFPVCRNGSNSWWHGSCSSNSGVGNRSATTGNAGSVVEGVHWLWTGTGRVWQDEEPLPASATEDKACEGSRLICDLEVTLTVVFIVCKGLTCL